MAMVAIMMVLIDGNDTTTTPSTILRLRGRASSRRNMTTFKPSSPRTQVAPCDGARAWAGCASRPRWP
eukprot:10618097-Lingulodinium_polyedra.AAC.1